MLLYANTGKPDLVSLRRNLKSRTKRGLQINSPIQGMGAQRFALVHLGLLKGMLRRPVTRRGTQWPDHITQSLHLSPFALVRESRIQQALPSLSTGQFRKYKNLASGF